MRRICRPLLSPARAEILQRPGSGEVELRHVPEEPKRFIFRKIERELGADIVSEDAPWSSKLQGERHFTNYSGASTAFMAGALGAASHGAQWNNAPYRRASSSYLESSRLGADYPIAPTGKKI